MCINFRHYLFFILQRTNLLSHYEIINPTLELTTAAAIVANNFFERIIHITTATDKLNHTHLNYWLNIIPNSIFHMGKWHALDISSLAFVLNNVWRLAPGTQSGSPAAAAALALAVTLLVVTLYLVEQRCRGVICPSELLGSQNRIGALWKSPHHLACCPAWKPDNVWIWVSNPPWVLWRFLGSSITRTTTRSTMHRGVILNTTRGKKGMFIQLGAH